MEFGDYIWNQREKCIQISTNMPSIGLVFGKIAFKIKAIFEKKTRTLIHGLDNQCPRGTVVKR